MINRRQALMSLAATTAWPMTPVQAQTFPTKPIRIIIPFAAGANSDVLTRQIAQRVTYNGGPIFVIENRPGGGGTIAAAAAKSAAPDGYTLFAANNATHAILPAIQNVPYNSNQDFQAVTQLFYFSNFLIVPERIPANQVRELVALAKSAGSLSLGSQGVGSPGHLLGAMLQQKAGIQLVHVPYPGGGGPMNIDVVAGRLDMVFSTYASLERHREQRKVKFLAIASPKRSAVAPDIPTLAEAGFPGVELDAWFGLVAPSGTPAAIISALNAHFVRAAQSPDLIDRFKAQGVTLAPSTSAEFARQIAQEGERLGAVAKAANIRVD